MCSDFPNQPAFADQGYSCLLFLVCSDAHLGLFVSGSWLYFDFLGSMLWTGDNGLLVMLKSSGVVFTLVFLFVMTSED